MVANKALDIIISEAWLNSIHFDGDSFSSEFDRIPLIKKEGDSPETSLTHLSNLKALCDKLKLHKPNQTPLRLVTTTLYRPLHLSIPDSLLDLKNSLESYSPNDEIILIGNFNIDYKYYNHYTTRFKPSLDQF